MNYLYLDYFRYCRLFQTKLSVQCSFDTMNMTRVYTNIFSFLSFQRNSISDKVIDARYHSYISSYFRRDFDCEKRSFYTSDDSEHLKSPDLKSSKDSQTFFVPLISKVWLLLVDKLEIFVVDIKFEEAIVEGILWVECDA